MNPYKAADGNSIASNGYTNLENYLNTLTGEVTIPPSDEHLVLVRYEHLGRGDRGELVIDPRWSVQSDDVGSNKDAVFEGTAGTVTVSGNVGWRQFDSIQ